MKFPSPHRLRRPRGMALVLILAFIVLLTIVAVAFFSTASGERQLADASSERVRALSLAESASEDVVTMLRDEIAAGSESGAEFSASGSTDLLASDRIYVPTAAANQVPFRFSGAAGNVWKWSAPSTPFFSGTTYNTAAVPAFPGASSLSTASASAAKNGRFVAPTRWAAPALTTSGSLPVPHWIYLSRAGDRITTWTAGTGDFAPQNSGAAVGRYAFILYNTGGLLDVNAAGYPVSADPTEIGRKAGLPFAALSVVDANLPSVVAWRDAGSQAGFPAGALASWRTFLTAPAGDRRFVTRRQVLAYLRSLGVQEDSLALVTHFTREKNAPSWGPRFDANDPALGGVSGFPYRTNRNSATAANRLLANVRATTDFSVTGYEADGSEFPRTVKAGDPLVARRFSLDKLRWVTRTGPAPGISAAAVQSAFGLTWDGSKWTYVGGSAILRLADVAAAQREANFFELLKAAVLEGSVGLTTDRVPLGSDVIGINDWLPYNRSTPRSYNANATATTAELVDSHILQLGLNIIDQADADSFPTRIVFRNYEFYGVENLPYLYRFSQIPYRPVAAFAGMTPPGPQRRMIASWLEPSFWNPLQGPSTDQPTRYRVRLVAGTISYFFRQTGTSAQIGPTSPSAGAGAAIEFSGPSLATAAAAPANLVQMGATVTLPRPEYRFTGDGQDWIGFWGGEAPIALGEDLTHGIFTLNGSAAGGGPRFVLEADYGGGDFREVQRFGFGATGGLWYGVNGAVYDRCREPARRSVQFGVLDPRTSRFGNQGFEFGGDRADLLGASAFWSSALAYNGQYNPKDANFTPADPATNPWFARTFFRYGDNSGTGGGPVYTDRDGVLRPADGTWTSAAVNTLPMRQEVDYRPVQLNRPFRSPGELAVVFRDLPWKSVDFSSARSGDAGLLDVFCVGAEGGSAGVLAGRLDLNTRQAPVLAALLSGAARMENSAGATVPATAAVLDPTTARTVADALVAVTGTAPLTNRGELVEALSTIPLGSLSSNIKHRRESVVRALAQPGQTRTWTFLLDLIAQSGRFPPGADGLDDFLVEGECRVWVHLALDRHTGKVIDRQWEFCDE